MADALAASEHFKRYGGADHFFINMKYSISMSKKLQVMGNPIAPPCLISATFCCCGVFN